MMIIDDLFIGVVSALIATIILTLFQRRKLWRNSKILVGDWDMYEINGHELTPLKDTNPTEIRRTAANFFTFTAPNIFTVKGSHRSGDRQRSLQGSIVLEPNYCQYALSTRNYDKELEYSVQQIWVIDKDHLYVVPQDPNKNTYSIHILKRKGSPGTLR